MRICSASIRCQGLMRPTLLAQDIQVRRVYDASSVATPK
ncbi:MAG: hypothetical protein OJF50_003410 [Nitrospira sp.]|nr:hypothetical protein [Nitrospira sp.]